MAIANELSGDIATAILGEKRISPAAMKDLKETVLRIHSTLQQMSQETRYRGSANKDSADNQAGAPKR